MSSGALYPAILIVFHIQPSDPSFPPFPTKVFIVVFFSSVEAVEEGAF